jgi:hypothetical protein
MELKSIVSALIFPIVGNLVSCISTDEKKPASPLELLDGEKYSPAGPAVSIGPIPVSGPLVTRRTGTKLTGKIVDPGSSGYFMRPVKMRQITLSRNDVNIIVSTDEHGKFSYSGEVSDGIWNLKVKGCATETKAVQVKGFENDFGELEFKCSSTR